MTALESINKDAVPKHIAIIMDGNGRWAKTKGKARIFGHRSALDAVRDSIEGSAELGVEVLTLYAFSTENWNRPRLEVQALFELLVKTIHKEVPTLNKNGIRLKAIGDLNSLPKNCQKELKSAMESTKTNTGMSLILALSYSARWEILNAVKTIAQEVKENNLAIIPENTKTFAADRMNILLFINLTFPIPEDPELIISFFEKFVLVY